VEPSAWARRLSEGALSQGVVMASRGGGMDIGIGVAIVVLFLAGCAKPTTGPASPHSSDRSGATSPIAQGLPCPSPATGQAGARVMIDWIDMIKWGGHQYAAQLPASTSTVAPGKVGSRIGLTRCHIADSTAGPQFTFHDGDATFLPVGTEINTIKGVPADTAVTAYRAGHWLYYRAVA
jgi:hypothetical protein